ncbi:MAG: beta-lactamase family protein [Planctomycetales bacterium]|nr:beta-lactamase family protein [Planctomycetales bacterium]
MNRLRSIVLSSLGLFLCSVGIGISTASGAELDFGEVRAYLDQAIDEKIVAGGVVLVMHHDEIVFETGFGYADIQKKTPFQVSTPVVIASISKPMLATAAFRLAESGKLQMNVPISKYLPEFGTLKLESGSDVSRAPTMIELFTHTSGMRSDYAVGGRPWFADWTKNQPLSFVVAKYARDFRLRSEPGTRFAYSGIGTDVAARVMEVADGKFRDEILIQEVCIPLGMDHTSYRSEVSATTETSMPKRYYRAKDGRLLVQRQRDLPAPNRYSASGGSIVSTAGDLAKWLTMYRDGGVHHGRPFLSEESYRAMMISANVGKAAQGGFFIRETGADGKPKVIGHTGSSGTSVWIDFDHDVIGIMLTQTAAKDSLGFRAELEKRIHQCFTMQLQ